VGGRPCQWLCLAALALAGTAARAAAPVTVYAAGDIARCAYPDPAFSGAAQTAAVVARGLAHDPAAVVFTLGDHTYPRGRAAEFTSCYGPTWGRFRDRTWPTPGNHEYATQGAKPYFDYFGARAGHGYYSFELAGWHVISLDSGIAGATMQAQLAWLRDDLHSHPARCTLAYWHIPLYSSGGHERNAVMQAAWRILYDAGAELVLSGHDHDYERFAPQDADGQVDAARGMRQFVVGTGGAYNTPFLWPAAHSEFRENNRFGVLRLRLLDGGYEWRFMPVAGTEEQGPAPDHGSATCHQR
jgi:acid phosphatase type 7